MNRALPDHSSAEETERLPPAALSSSTVSEIAAWLVGQPLDAVERELIRQTLEACNGDRALAASVLGLSLPRLRKKLTAYAVRGEALDDGETAPKARNVAPPPPADNDAGLTVVESETAVAAETVEAEIAEAERFVLDVPATGMAAVDMFSIDPAAVDDVAFELMAADFTAETDIEPFPETFAPDTVESFEPEIPEPAAISPEAVERPKLLAAPASPPRQRRVVNFRLLAGLAAVSAAVAAVGFYAVSDEREPGLELNARPVPQLQTAITEKAQPFERRIPVPVWIAPPPLPAAQPMSVDIAAERRAKAPAAAQTDIPAPVRVPGPLERSNIEADTRLDAAPALASANSDFDTRMELARPNSEQDVRMELTRPNAEQDVRMELARPDIELDIRMEAPVLAAADGAETTGSLAEPPFTAPERVPLPPARLDPEAQPQPRPVQRQAARPQPQAETPTAPPFIFPFSLFMPRETRGTGTGGESAPRPFCCEAN